MKFVIKLQFDIRVIALKLKFDFKLRQRINFYFNFVKFECKNHLINNKLLLK